MGRNSRVFGCKLLIAVTRTTRVATEGVGQVGAHNILELRLNGYV